MDYFGIKTRQRKTQDPYIWWISNSPHDAWMAFFNHQSPSKEYNAHNLPLAEAIQAYEGIGYKCVPLSVKEVIECQK